MKVRTIHLKEGEQLEITFKGEKVLRVGSEQDATGYDILVDVVDTKKFGCFDSYTGRNKLNKQLKDQK